MCLKTALFYCDGFCQISGLVDVAAPEQRHIIGEDLQRDGRQQWLQQRGRLRQPDDLVGVRHDDLVALLLAALDDDRFEGPVNGTAPAPVPMKELAAALAAGRALQFPGAVALLTTGYSVGQIVGPVAVAPLLHNGFQQALLAGAAVVLLAALAALLMWISGRQPRCVVDPDGGVPRERVDDSVHGRVVFSPPPHQ